MDHPSSVTSAQPWRAAAIVAAAVATIELLILVTLAVALGSEFLAGTAKDVVTAPMRIQSPSTQATGERAGNDAAKPPSKSSEGDAILSRRETSVIVLNGNGVAGAAAVAAEQVRKHGYLIAGTDNAPRTTFARSLVMYRPGYEAEARRLAKDIGIRRVVPLDGMRARDLQGAHIAYIIGS